MYKTFLKSIKANTIRERLEDFVGTPDDLSGFDQDTIIAIKTGDLIKDKEILKKIAENPKAAVLYLVYQTAQNRSTIQQRFESLKAVDSTFEDKILDDWAAALWYFDNYYQHNPNSEFFEKIKDKIKENEYIELVTPITRLIGQVIPDLEAMILEKLSSDSKLDAENDTRAFQNFNAYIQMLANTGLRPSKENITDFNTYLNNFKEYLKIKTPKQSPNEPQESKRSYSKLSPEAKNIVDEINNVTGKIKIDIGNVDTVYNSNATKFNAIKERSKLNSEAYKNIKNEILNEIKEYNLGMYYLIIKKLLKASLQNRSKRMIKAGIVKAYTNYYIKNYLPGLLRQASPDMLPQVINTGVQEVQNMMYGDNAIQDFNNPIITKQISNGISQAVKDPDLIPGGAADGLTLESIAQKWSPIYNIPVEQLIPILEKQLDAGTIVESEHTNNPTMAREIAMDHLTEAADYYSYLENMEQLFPADDVAVKPLEEPENFEPEFLDNPDKKDHVCDGSCGPACQCHHEEIVKPQTVEDKIESLNDGMTVFVVSDGTPIAGEPGYDEVFAHIENLAKALKR